MVLEKIKNFRPPKLDVEQFTAEKMKKDEPSEDILIEEIELKHFE